jgi:glycosyltransferase involved in cell wall biosynthesis
MSALRRLKAPYTIGYLTHGTRNVGGGEYLLSALIQSLRKDLFRPVLFYGQKNAIVSALERNGVETIPVGLNRKLTALFRDDIARHPRKLFPLLPAVIQDAFVVRQRILSEGIDLLHPHDNFCKILGGIAARLSGIPTVAHCHDLLGNSVMDTFLLLAQKFLIDQIIAVSASVHDRFVRFAVNSKQIRTIPNGIDSQRFQPGPSNVNRSDFGIPADHVVIGAIGMFDLVKGHIFLLKALKLLRDRGIEKLTCLIVGDGRLREHLKTYVQEAGLNQQVTFLGYRRDVADLLSLMDIFVMPSIRESFGIAALEAMAMKLPVIASEVGGLAEIVEHRKTGLLLPPGDPRSLADAMETLAKDQAMRAAMGDAGRKRVENRFSLRATVTSVETLYLECLGGST